jgi:hypothetical protein
MIFLIVYDTKASSLLEIVEFDESARRPAMDALRTTQEKLIGELDHVEVGLFESPTRATLERTHSRYFKSLAELGASLSEAAKKSA